MPELQFKELQAAWQGPCQPEPVSKRPDYQLILSSSKHLTGHSQEAEQPPPSLSKLH